MHLDGNLYAMVGGELRVFLPIGGDHLIPLPVENYTEIRRPRAGNPVRSFGIRRVSGTSRKINHGRDAELFRKQNGLAADIPMLLTDGLIRMKRIAMTT